MRKAFIAALLLSAGSFAVPAHATGWDPYRGGNGGDASAQAININDIHAQGGKGGNAYAVNHNANIAKGGDATANSISDSRANARIDSNINNSVRNNNHQKQEQTSISKSNSESYSSSDNANNANQSVNFEAQARNPVSTAYAPPLVAGEDTCMGSSSIGGQGVGFGISIGTSWTDENCQRLKNSRQLAALGFRRASVALLCVNDDVARAMAAAGLPCRVEGGDRYELTTVSLPPDQFYQEAARERVVYSRIVEERPRYTPKKRKHKKVRCRMVRQCTR